MDEKGQAFSYSDEVARLSRVMDSYGILQDEGSDINDYSIGVRSVATNESKAVSQEIDLLERSA